MKLVLPVLLAAGIAAPAFAESRAIPVSRVTGYITEDGQLLIDRNATLPRGIRISRIFGPKGMQQPLRIERVEASALPSAREISEPDLRAMLPSTAGRTNGRTPQSIVECSGAGEACFYFINIYHSSGALSTFVLFRDPNVPSQQYPAISDACVGNARFFPYGANHNFIYTSAQPPWDADLVQCEPCLNVCDGPTYDGCQSQTVDHKYAPGKFDSGITVVAEGRRPPECPYSWCEDIWEGASITLYMYPD